VKPTNPNQELKKIYRFFKNQVSKYIFLVVDDQRILNYLIIQAQVELKKQVEEFLAGNLCNGLIVSNVNTLIYRYEKETTEKLNRSRDTFEKFRIPVIFVLNNDNLKNIIAGMAISFNQLGLIRKEKKNHPRALRYLIQAFAIFAKIGSPKVNIVRDNILDVKEKMPAKQFARILKEFKIPEDTF